MSAADPFPDHLTLREAIDLHQQRLGAKLVDGGPNPEVAEMFAAHDACHAVFGCDLSLRGEALADTWTMTASTIRASEYLAYLQHPEVVAVVREIGWFKATLHTVAALPWVLAAWWRSRSVTRRWDFWNWRSHIDDTLGEIRRSHGIVRFV